MTDEEDTLLSSYPFNSSTTATYLNMSQHHNQHQNQQPFQGYQGYSKSNPIQLYMPPHFDQQQQQNGILPPPPPALANLNYTTTTPHHHHHHLSNSSSPLPMHPQYSYSPTGQHFSSTASYLKESPLQPRAAPSLFMDSAVPQYPPTTASTTNSPSRTSSTNRVNSSSTSNNAIAAAAAAVAAASYTPFGYVPTVASTVPVNSPRTKPATHRRRRTGSKRSVEEMLLESTIPTNTTLNDPIPPPRPGPSVGLLSMPLSSQPMPLPGAPGAVMPNTPPTLPLSIPEPPLALAPPINPNVMKSDPQPRPKKKSKYTPEQDQIILSMKKNGLPWTDISKAAQCGNHIAARNRYQVLIGQQGGGAVVWDSDDTMKFKRMLEDGERAKWNFIANELSRIRSKKATPMACQRKVKELFEHNPAMFGIVLNSGETSL